jgi:uncharacterized protein
MNYFSNAFDGHNQWWRYLVLFIASLIGGQTVGGIPLMAVMFYGIFTSGGAIQPNPENMADLSVYGIGQNLGLFLMILPYLASLFILLLLFKPFHRRHYKTLFSVTGKIRWNRFFTAAALWAAFSAVYYFTDYALNPENFTMNFEPGPFIVLILISLTLIPFQASYEEVLFRGYLAQGTGVWTKNRILVILIPSVIFGLMHSLNPEVGAFGFWIMMPHYVFFGLLFGILTVLDDGIELAMGAHTANNVFMSIFVTNKVSVLQTPALMVQESIEPVKELIALVSLGVLFIVVLSFIYKWKYSVLRERIYIPEPQSQM